MRRRALFLILTVGVLAGCGPAPEEKAEALLAQGNSTALSVLVTDQLQKKPAHPYFNGLKAVELLQDCVARDCGAADDLSPLHTIKTHLEKTPDQVAVAEGKTHAFSHDISTQLVAYALAHPMSDGLQNLIQLGLPPQTPTAPLAAHLADDAYTQLLNDKIAPTTQLLRAVVTLGAPDGHTSGAQMVLNMLTGNIAALTQPLVPPPEDLYTTMLPGAILVYLKQAQPGHFATTFLDVLRQEPLTLANTPLPLLLGTPAQKKAFSQGVADLAHTEGYGKLLAADLQKPNQVADPLAYVQAVTLKAALRCTPDNPDLWQQFMPAALKAVKPGDSLQMVYDGFDLASITAPVAQSNNDRLFDYIDKILGEGHDISAALKEVIYRPDAQQDLYIKKADEALTRAIDAAITQKNIPALLAYIQGQGNLMAGREKQVGQALQAGLDGLWAAHDLATIRTIAALLKGPLHLPDFDLERQVNAWLVQLLNSDNAKKKLVGNSFTDLLQPLSQAGVNLAPQMPFIQEVFAQQPEVIQNQLQAAASNNTGRYGLPRALMAFHPYLNTKTRDTLVNNALLAALRQDDTLTPLTLATLGSQFIEANPALATEAIATVLLERSKTLDESRAAWAAASAPLREAAGKLNPQFTALMLALDAHTQGNKAEAAQQMSKVTQAPYTDFAQPYMEEYRALLLPYAGTYTSAALTGSTRVVALTLAPGEELLTARLTLVSALGQVVQQDVLLKNRGNVYQAETKASLSPRDMTLTLDTTHRDPALGNFSFEKVYGAASTLKLQDNGRLTLTSTDGQTRPFTRTTPAAPQGAFTVTTTLGADDEAQGLLAPGTRFDFGATADRTSINITLPDGTQAVTTARYNPKTLMVDFSFPYSQAGATLEAVARCQLIDKGGICAAHNRHWAGKRYTHVVEVNKAN